MPTPQENLEIKSISPKIFVAFSKYRFANKIQWRRLCVEGSKEVLSGIKFLENAVPSQRMIM